MAVARLRWCDVNLSGEWITSSEDTDKMGVRWRHVPISRRVAKVLTRWRNHSKGEWVFGSGFGNPISKSAVDEWMRKLYSASGIKKPYRSGWHSLRRKFATELANDGVSLKVIMELGGWKTESALMRSIQPDKEHTEGGY